MLFSIEADEGFSVSGYVVPDGFVGSLKIVLRHQGKDVFERPADDFRVGLIEAGRHQTGTCGYTVDEWTLPGLSAMDDLEIYEAETQRLLYRRRRPDHIAKKILRLESHLFPLWRLDNSLNSRFQYSANRIDDAGRETTAQFFLLNLMNSIYLSGRILYRSYASYIESKFDVVFIMHHPLEEFAERLIILAQIKKTGSGVLGVRDNLIFRAAMEFAQSLPFHDSKELGRKLRNIPFEIAQVFANPVTRQLTTSTPDEMPTGAAVSSALDILGSFALVALRRAPGAFLGALAEYLGVDAHELPPLSKLPGVTALAQTLKRTRAVDGLLEFDLELYAHIAEAYKKSAPTRGRSGAPGRAAPPSETC